MSSNPRLAGTFALFCAATLLSCGEGPPLSPSSLTPLATPPSSLSIRPSDYHDPAPMPDPAPAPTPDPDPAPAPTPDPANPAPATVTVTIVGSAGSPAFAPNPIQAAMGDLLVWANTDSVLHSIVLDDGTPVGDVAPGASTAPMPLTSATATYHCTIHPSMVGSINGAADPTPPPDYAPPPPDDDYYGGYRH